MDFDLMEIALNLPGATNGAESARQEYYKNFTSCVGIESRISQSMYKVEIASQKYLNKEDQVQFLFPCNMLYK